MWELPKCDSSAELEDISEDPIWHGYKFHNIGLVIAIAFSAIAIIVSLVLVFLHATHYSKPAEQRHIIRILFMVPIYAAVSFLSFYHYHHSVYYEVIRDCYEAFAIASFFSLMCAYVAEDLHYQKDYFRTIEPKAWIRPMNWMQKCCGGKEGFLRTPRSGLTWFNVVWVSIFQYCFIRVSMTVVAVVTQAFDRYCLESLNPAFAHVWVMVIEAFSVTVAMYCLIQFYVQIKDDIAQHKPLLKVLAIKLVIFLSFWQTLIIGFLTGSGAVKPTPTIAVQDMKIGIPAMLLCLEMALFAILHIWAFSYRPYIINGKQYHPESVPGNSTSNAVYTGGRFGWKAIINAFNPWDLIKAVGRSARWLFRGRKHRLNDKSYAKHHQSQALGQSGANDSTLSIAGPKMGALDVTTSSVGNERPRFPGVELNEGDTLLKNQQQMPMSRPVNSRMNTNKSGISDDYEMPDSYEHGQHDSSTRCADRGWDKAIESGNSQPHTR